MAVGPNGRQEATNRQADRHSAPTRSKESRQTLNRRKGIPKKHRDTQEKQAEYQSRWSVLPFPLALSLQPLQSQLPTDTLASRNPQTPPLQARHHRPARNPPLPTLHRPPPPQTPLLKTRKPLPSLPLPHPSSHPPLTPPSPIGPRNRPLPPPRRRSVPALAIASHSSAAGGRGGVHGAPVRGHESVRHPCEEGHDYAEGCAVGEEDSRGVGGVGMSAGKGIEGWGMFRSCAVLKLGKSGKGWQDLFH